MQRHVPSLFTDEKQAYFKKFIKNMWENNIQWITDNVNKTNINITNEEGRTVLHLACHASKPEIVKVLLIKKPNLLSKDKYHDQPLHCALLSIAYNDKPDRPKTDECGLILIEYIKKTDNTALLSEKNGMLQTPLFIAVGRKLKKSFDALLAAKVELDAQTGNSHSTALHKALENLANYKKSQTAYDFFVKFNIDAAKKLIAADANCNISDSQGRTALDKAKASPDYHEIVNCIVANQQNNFCLR